MARYRWRRAIRGVRMIVRVKNSFLGIPEGLWPFLTVELCSMESQKPRLWRYFLCEQSDVWGSLFRWKTASSGFLRASDLYITLLHLRISKNKQSSEKPRTLVALSLMCHHYIKVWLVWYFVTLFSCWQYFALMSIQICPPSIQNMFWCVGVRWKINLSRQPLSPLSQPLAQMFGNQQSRWSDDIWWAKR